MAEQRSMTRYQAWNAAVAQVIYSREAAGKPVYLDLDEGVLAALRDIAEPNAVDPAEALVEAVLTTLNFRSGPSGVFRQPLAAVRRWKKGEDRRPPESLALLAVLSLAAEEMRGEDGVGANNYYARAQEVLNLSDTQLVMFQEGYRQPTGKSTVAEELWASLNEWLEGLEGARGLPTAYAPAAGHSYIGLPLSQALVRETDRVGFSDMFATYGLAGGQLVPPNDMEAILDEWSSRSGSPFSNSLLRSWQSSYARAHIVDEVIQILGAWDGSAETPRQSTGMRFDAVRLMANPRRFPSTELELSIVVPSRPGVDKDELELRGTQYESEALLNFERVSDNWLCLSEPHLLDYGSVFAGDICLEGSEGGPLERKARRVVPFSFDDRLAVMVEVERVRLADRSALIVHADACDDVDAFLNEFARTGWQRSSDLPGLPSGWLYYSDVEIPMVVPRSRVVEIHCELQAIQPMGSSQARFAGGLKLPGHMPKWSSKRPPEFTASVTTAEMMTARIECVATRCVPVPQVSEIEVEGSVLIWDLADLYLPDGDYSLTYSADGGEVSELKLRLRSADHRAIDFDEDEHVALHSGRQMEFALWASRVDEGFAVVPEVQNTVDSVTGDRLTSWYASRKLMPRQRAERSLIRVGKVCSECMTDGRHYMDVETALNGATTVDGTCRYCGLVRRYPTSGKRKRDFNAVVPTMRKFEPSSVLPIRKADSELVPWSDVFDAICHVRQGRRSRLERIAQQVEGSALGVYLLIRRLEGLGHINVVRDPLTMQVDYWSVARTTLVGTAGSEGGYLLCGFRSESLLVALEDACYVNNVQLSCSEIVGPHRYEIECSDAETARRIGAAVSREAGHDLDVIPAGCSALASSLPPLGKAIAGLAKVQMPGSQSLEFWDTTLARFEPCTDASRPGAYRSMGYRSQYLFRRPEDVELGTALLGDVRIVKFAAALQDDSSLAGYDERGRFLYVPLGADLPGLYARTAVLASGRTPVESLTERVLQYQNVPPEIGHRICDALTTKETT